MGRLSTLWNCLCFSERTLFHLFTIDVVHFTKSWSLSSLVAKWLMWLDLLVFTSQRCPHLFHRDKSSYSSAIHFCTHQWLRFIDLKTIKRSKSISQHVNIRVLCLHTHCQISPIKTQAYNKIIAQQETPSSKTSCSPVCLSPELCKTFVCNIEHCIVFGVDWLPWSVCALVSMPGHHQGSRRAMDGGNMDYQREEIWSACACTNILSFCQKYLCK